jgi:hypothetical protein
MKLKRFRIHHSNPPGIRKFAGLTFDYMKMAFFLSKSKTKCSDELTKSLRGSHLANQQLNWSGPLDRVRKSVPQPRPMQAEPMSRPADLVQVDGQRPRHTPSPGLYGSAGHRRRPYLPCDRRHLSTCMRMIEDVSKTSQDLSDVSKQFDQDTRTIHVRDDGDAAAQTKLDILSWTWIPKFL